jgi:hypothetical protein
MNSTHDIAKIATRLLNLLNEQMAFSPDEAIMQTLQGLYEGVQIPPHFIPSLREHLQQSAEVYEDSMRGKNITRSTMAVFHELDQALTLVPLPSTTIPGERVNLQVHHRYYVTVCGFDHTPLMEFTATLTSIEVWSQEPHGLDNEDTLRSTGWTDDRTSILDPEDDQYFIYIWDSTYRLMALRYEDLDEPDTEDTYGYFTAKEV